MSGAGGHGGTAMLIARDRRRAGAGGIACFERAGLGTAGAW